MLAQADQLYAEAVAIGVQSGLGGGAALTILQFAMMIALAEAAGPDIGRLDSGFSLLIENMSESQVTVWLRRMEKRGVKL